MREQGTANKHILCLLPPPLVLQQTCTKKYVAGVHQLCDSHTTKWVRSSLDFESSTTDYHEAGVHTQATLFLANNLTQSSYRLKDSLSFANMLNTHTGTHGFLQTITIQEFTWQVIRQLQALTVISRSCSYLHSVFAAHHLKADRTLTVSGNPSGSSCSQQHMCSKLAADNYKVENSTYRF